MEFSRFDFSKTLKTSKISWIMISAKSMKDEISEIVLNLHSIIFPTGTISVDIKDLMLAAKNGNNVLSMESFRAKGPMRAELISEKITSFAYYELLRIKPCKIMLINFFASKESAISEITTILNQIRKEKLPAFVKFGITCDEAMGEVLKIVVIRSF